MKIETPTLLSCPQAVVERTRSAVRALSFPSKWRIDARVRYPVWVGSTDMNSVDRSTGASEAVIEHVLIRHHLLEEVRRGRLSKKEVCDATPELLRVANSMGKASKDICPICGSEGMVHVSFAFGKGLPASGRGVGSPEELQRLTESISDMDLYLVEVCIECRWNHLLRKLSY